MPSKQNTADIASRGSFANESAIWFIAPKFLSESEINWPKGSVEDTELAQQEIRNPLLKTTIIGGGICPLICHNSSRLHILRINAYVHRVFNKQKRNPFVTLEELQSTFYRIIYI